MGGKVGGAEEEDSLVVGLDVVGLGEDAGQGTNTKTRRKARQNTQNQKGEKNVTLPGYHRF